MARVEPGEFDDDAQSVLPRHRRRRRPRHRRGDRQRDRPRRSGELGHPEHGDGRRRRAGRDVRAAARRLDHRCSRCAGGRAARPRRHGRRRVHPGPLGPVAADDHRPRQAAHGAPRAARPADRGDAAADPGRARGRGGPAAVGHGRVLTPRHRHARHRALPEPPAREAQPDHGDHRRDDSAARRRLGAGDGHAHARRHPPSRGRRRPRARSLDLGSDLARVRDAAGARLVRAHPVLHRLDDLRPPRVGLDDHR